MNAPFDARPAGTWLGMIWAQDAERGIGRDGDLPWHLPEDLAFFRDRTRGHAVLMGRAQWESLPDRVRPLPGRRNIVLSRDPTYDAPGASVVTSLTDALEAVTGERSWVIGGGQLYALAMPYADELVVTQIDGTFDADVHAPEVGPEWVRVERTPEQGWTQASNGMRFAIERYVRADEVAPTI
ncbi:dihydrofolate reductase [Sanguibacter sp. A247]|uniref:dihydrofolate reductase n=1 Tax=unclassified Sanguibacter TaxID=2645534 RepID=UPI003FD6FFC0